MNAEVLTTHELRQKVAKLVAERGIDTIAFEWQVPKADLGFFIRGEIRPPRNVKKALRLREVICYEPIPKGGYGNGKS